MASTGMQCEQVRAALSARLDGVYPDPARSAATDAHLATCAGCRGWVDDAAVVTRLARTTLAPAPIRPDDNLLAVVLAAAPGRRWTVADRILRLALAVIGFAQFILGVIQIASLGMAPGQPPVGGMTADHLWHESAAWNIAIGAGYAWIALRRSRPAGALPMLTAFIGVLLLLSIGDLLTGEVAADALLTHGFILLGYVILLVLRHPALDPPPGRRTWRLRLDGAETVDAVRRAPAPVRGVTARSGESRAA